MLSASYCDQISKVHYSKYPLKTSLFLLLVGIRNGCYQSDHINWLSQNHEWKWNNTNLISIFTSLLSFSICGSPLRSGGGLVKPYTLVQKKQNKPFLQKFNFYCLFSFFIMSSCSSSFFARCLCTTIVSVSLLLLEVHAH